MKACSYGRRPGLRLPPPALALSLVAALAACGGGTEPGKSASAPGSGDEAAPVAPAAGPEARGPASALAVPAVERGASRILVVARGESHGPVEGESHVFRLEGHDAGDFYGFSRGRRTPGGEVLETTIRINRFGEEHRASDALSGEGFGMVVREGGAFVAYSGSSRVRYSSPAQGSLRVEASEGGYEEVLLVSGHGALYERQMNGQVAERGGLDPDGNLYRLRRVDDPEGQDELEYDFRPSPPGLVVGLGSAEPLAEFYVEGAETLFPSGEPDLLGLALTELAVGRAWRVFPVLMRTWKLAAGR